MPQLFDKLVSFYQRINWPMTPIPDNTIISTIYQGEQGQWTFVASTDESTQIITLFSRAPTPCPPHLIATMSEFLHRANFGMTHGAWVMDIRDGEIRFRVGVDSSGIEINDHYLRDLTIYTNQGMDFYLPAIDAILKSEATATEAMEMLF